MKIVKKCGTTLPNPYNWLKKNEIDTTSNL
jgi:hypothetical protein